MKAADSLLWAARGAAGVLLSFTLCAAGAAGEATPAPDEGGPPADPGVESSPAASPTAGGGPPTEIRDRVRSLLSALAAGGPPGEKAAAGLRELPSEALPLLEEAAALEEAGAGGYAALEEAVRALRARRAERIRELVARLGDDVFETREAAQEELLRLGPAVLAAVERAEGGGDPEVAWRAAEIRRAIERGPFAHALEKYCLLQGIPAGGLEEIETAAARRFCPESRFFGVEGLHYRVGKEGAVAPIPLSTGGDLTEMIGEPRPLLPSGEDRLDFLRFVVGLRYGFEDFDRDSMALDARGPREFGSRASSRTFILFLDEEGRLERLVME